MGILKYEYYTAVLVVADEKERGGIVCSKWDDEDDRIWRPAKQHENDGALQSLFSIILGCELLHHLHTFFAEHFENWHTSSTMTDFHQTVSVDTKETKKDNRTMSRTHTSSLAFSSI
jgi:hypothetical protein